MASDHTPIITLLTDFGTSDHYVAVMKGVILSIAPRARLIDITHQVDSTNVMAGAYLLASSVSWFPDGTIHLAVVDPGVGSDRKIIAGRWGKQVIVTPDNGLVSLVHLATRADAIHEVTNHQYFLAGVSDTFHGRDIMAPVVAHLANGVPLANLGPAIDQPGVVNAPQPEVRAGELIGQVIHIDHFGNLVSNITAVQLREFQPTSIHIKERVLGPLVATYADVLAGQPLAVIGSSNMLEISISQGSARDDFEVQVGENVVLRH